MRRFVPDRSAAVIVVSGLVVIVVAGDLRLGLARLLLVLLFLTIVPGSAVVDLALPQLRDVATAVLLSIGVSVAIDVLVSEAALVTHAWDPAWMITVIALAAISLAMARIAMADRLAIAGAGDAEGLESREQRMARVGGAAIRQELVVLLCVVVFALLAGATRDGSLSRLLAGAVGAVIAGGAGITCVVLVVRSQVRTRASAQSATFWAAAALAAVVVEVVVVRFLALG